MKHIETLLIRHGMDPSIVDLSDKERLSVWLSEAESGCFYTFEQFADHAQAVIHGKTKKMINQADQLLGLIKHATDTIEPLLGKYPERAIVFSAEVEPRSLTDQHIQLLRILEVAEIEIEQIIPDFSATDLDISILTELSLRQIALLEAGENKRLSLSYNQIIQDVNRCISAVENTKRQLTANGTAFYSVLSQLAKHASAALTRVNRQKASQTEYFRILQQMLSQLHTISQAVKHIQQEVSHV